jgi:hypothetical protein
MLGPDLGYREHLGAEVDADQFPLRPDALENGREVGAGAAGDVDHRLAGSKLERFDAPKPPTGGPAHALVVPRGPMAILLNRSCSPGLPQGLISFGVSHPAGPGPSACEL